LDDAALVALAREGHDDATETLLARHENGAYTAALRLLGEPADAEDVAQEALVKAYLRIGDLAEDGNFGAWIRKIAVNLSLNVLRRRGLLRFEPLEPPARDGDDRGGDVVHVDDAPSPEDAAMNAHLRQELELLVRRLPPDQRVAVVLRDMYGYDVADVAALQRCNLSAAKMRISRGRAQLRRLMTDARIDAAGLQA